MIKIKNKGFTLIELLAVIVLISLVLGVGGSFFYNIISKANDKTELLAMDSIKKSASTYIEEYPADVVWIKNVDKTSYSCISIDALIDKGYLKKEDANLKNINDYKYLSITRDENQNIIDEHFSKFEACGTDNRRKVPIPTAKEYCSYPTYIGTEQLLLKKIPVGFEFKKNTGRNAGNYTIEAILQDGYIWNDNSMENKKISCSIKKAIPFLYFEKDSYSNSSYSNGEDGTNLDDSIIYLKSDVAGSVTLKSSNLKVASAILENDKITKNVRNKIVIQKKATNKSNVYITFKVDPDDNQNYNSSEIVYTIGNIKKVSVKKPVCRNLYYNGVAQNLVSKNDGYFLLNNTQINLGKYQVIAELNYGYIWNDGTEDSYELDCEIQAPLLNVTYDTNGGSGCTKETVKYGDSYGNLCNPIRRGYTFDGWYTKLLGGTKIDSTTKVENFLDHTIYAHWKNHICTVNFSPNGGRFDGKDAQLVRKLEYGWESNSQYGIWNASSGTYDAKLVGYSPKSGQEWINSDTADTFDETQNYTAIDFCPNLESTDQEVTLKVNWVKNNYTLTYNSNEGSACSPASKTVGYNEKYDTLCTPSRTGYKFLGWYTAASGGNAVTKDTVMGASNATIYAHWMKNTYTLTYNSNGGNACTPTSKTVNYDEKYGTLCKPSKHDYTFDGWYTEASGGNKVDENTKIGAKNTTIYAHWTGVKKTNIAFFNYKIDEEHNFEKIGNQVNVSSSVECTYQVPKTSCTIKTPGIKIYDSTTAGKTKTLFKFQWKNNSDDRDVVELDTDITLSKEKSEYTLFVTANSNYYNKEGKIKGGKENAWVRTSDALTKAMNNNQLIGIVTKDYNFYWKDGNYQIGTANHLIWLKGHGYGARCNVVGNATKDSCNKNQCNSTNCRVPASGEGWSSLRALKW